MKFLLILSCTIAMVSGEDIQEIKFPAITIDSVTTFFQDYWDIANKLHGRVYNNPLEKVRPQQNGPLKYEEHRAVGNILTDLWSTWWGFVFNPNSRSFWKIFAVFASYFIMPYTGGYIRAQTYVEYMRDKETYDNGEVSLDYLYMEAMDLVKMGFWSFFGLLDENNKVYE